LRFRHGAQLEHEPERDAALVLGFERAADIAQRPVLVGEDVRERAHEDDVQRGRLARQHFRHDGGGVRVCVDQLRQMDAPLPAHII